MDDFGGQNILRNNAVLTICAAHWWMFNSSIVTIWNLFVDSQTWLRRLETGGVGR